MEKLPKKGTARNGQEMHYSVGAVIEQDGKYLLIERNVPPLGFASIAGHVDEGEDNIAKAMIREVEEESGLKVISYEFLKEEELDWNWCSKGVNVHYWYVFKCKVEGTFKVNEREVNSIAWYTPEEIAKLNLEPVWKYWFEKLGIIKKEG